jgi:hypothetical protein
MERSGPCVFCGLVREYTQEHVIPRWVRKILKTGPVEITDRETRDRFRYDQTLTLVVNSAVCRDCNGGWMKRLGERVMPDIGPAIVGDFIALTAGRAQILASWVVERALLFDLAFEEGGGSGKFAPPSCLRWLYARRDDLMPPPGTQVWMAYLDATTKLPAWSVIGSWPERLEKPDGYLSAFSLGCVVFLVFGQAFRESDHHALDGRPLGQLVLPGRFSGYLVPIWPDPDELVVWPPRLGLSAVDRDEVVKLLSAARVLRKRPARLHVVD